MNPAPGSDGRKKTHQSPKRVTKKKSLTVETASQGCHKRPANRLCSPSSLSCPDFLGSCPGCSRTSQSRISANGDHARGEETEPRAVPRARATHPSRAAPATAVGWPGSGIREGCRGSRPEDTDLRLTPLPPLAVASEHLLLRTPR